MAVVRGDGHQQTEYSEMTVETDHPVVRVVRLSVDSRRGENLRAITRRHQRQNADGEILRTDSVPVMEITTASGDKVKLYLYEDEIILTTEDLYR
jgi:hypothetical protein